MKIRPLHPLDPDLGIVWPTGTPLLSTKDIATLTLVEAQATGPVAAVFHVFGVRRVTSSDLVHV